jgi:NitT/TauT family transport system permease protein
VAPPTLARCRHRRCAAYWAALVYLLKVPPFIAPSPLLVVTTLYADRRAACSTCCRLHRSHLGFLLGNLTAILIATVFRAQEGPWRGVLPGRGGGEHDPVVAKAPIWCCCSATAWSRRSPSRR